MKNLVKKLFRSTHWEDAGQGWEGLEDTLTLSGWSRARRVVVLRRKLTGELLITGKDEDQDQGQLAFIGRSRTSVCFAAPAHPCAMKATSPPHAMSTPCW